jgi:ammonium transporter, Amt family
MQNVNKWFRSDEGLDVFKLYGIGGIVGSILTGSFASASGSSLDGTTLASGAIDGNGILVGRQFAEITAISAYSLIVSCALLYVLKYISGLHLRVSHEAELMGMDLDQFFHQQIGGWSTFVEEQRRSDESSLTFTPGTPEEKGDAEQSSV